MDTLEFWEDFYAGRTRWSGRPNELLVAEVEAELPGDALDLGCGEGGDAIWLAQCGWRVTAVDVSTNALAAAAEHARLAGVGDAIQWERHDLDETFPDGSFDLVASCYLQSPVAVLGRAAILRAAAATVRPGGLLLVIGHAGPGHDGHHVDMPGAVEVLADLDLGDDWDVERCADVERPTRPDSVVRVRRATGSSVELTELLDGSLRAGDDGALRSFLLANSRLPGPRANLELIDAFADAAAMIVRGDDAPEAALESLLDRWAGLGADDAPGGEPEVILPCAAIAAYGAVGAARPEWIDDELGKLRRAASDARWRIREIVAQALQRLLAADWRRVYPVLAGWAADDDPLVVRAAAAAVAEPPLLDELASSDDPDVQWIATQNLKKARLARLRR